MVDHGQTVVISLPNHSTPWLETVFTLQPWCYHGCTCSIHPLAGKKVLLKPRRDYSILNMKGNMKWILVVLVVK